MAKITINNYPLAGSEAACPLISRDPGERREREKERKREGEKEGREAIFDVGTSFLSSLLSLSISLLFVYSYLPHPLPSLSLSLKCILVPSFLFSFFGSRCAKFSRKRFYVSCRAVHRGIRLSAQTMEVREFLSARNVIRTALARDVISLVRSLALLAELTNRCRLILIFACRGRASCSLDNCDQRETGRWRKGATKINAPRFPLSFK